MSHVRIPNQATRHTRSKDRTRWRLDVTEPIIAKAIRNTSGGCVIADAVRLSIPGAERVQVDLQTIRFSLPARGQRFTFLTPRIAQESLVAFDAGDPVLPFQVELRNPGITPTKTAAPDDAFQNGVQGEPVKPRRPKATVANPGLSNQLRVGGRTPPRLAMATTTRRQFGLRVLRANQG